MKLAGIEAVSFDADGTLWDFHKVMRSGLALAVDEIRRRFPDLAQGQPSVEGLIAVRERLGPALRANGASHEEVRLVAFGEALRELGHADDGFARELTQHYLEHRFARIELFDDALPVLARLKRELRVGVVSNGNSYPRACGLDGWFDYEVFSTACREQKPSCGIFDAAARAAGCPAGAIAHVGDSLAEDVLGACAAGQVAVWLNRGGAGERLPGDIPEIRSLAELPPLLGL